MNIQLQWLLKTFIFALIFRHNKHVFYRVLYIYYIHIFTHVHTYNHIYRYIHTHTHVYIYVKLFVICFEIFHTQIPHHMATSQLHLNKSQLAGFHKIRDTRELDKSKAKVKFIYIYIYIYIYMCVCVCVCVCVLYICIYKTE